MACPHCQLASRGSAGRARASWSSLLDPRERRAGRRSRCTTECRYSDLSPDRRRRCRGCGRSFAGQRQSARDARSASGCHRGGVGWSACSRCGHLVRLKINVFVVDSQHDCLLLRHAVVASRAGVEPDRLSLPSHVHSDILELTGPCRSLHGKGGEGGQAPTARATYYGLAQRTPEGCRRSANARCAVTAISTMNGAYLTARSSA